MSLTGMRQRCLEHDYCAPSFYMITTVTEPRRGCLSELDGSLLKLSPMGKVAEDAWRRTSRIYAGVEACECVVMPDHFHGILRVKERLARHMGHIVKAFKRVSEQECRSRGPLLPPDRSRGLLLPPDQGRGLHLPPARGPAPAAASAAGPQHAALWQEGYQDTILLRRGQLKAMVHYIADNPRRLAAKRANPELFTVVSTQPVTDGRSCPAIGNRFLLDRPVKRQVRISRSIAPADLADKKEALLYAAGPGAVLVSPCISPGEKEIARAALEAGLSLIVLLENGFAPLYKPPGRYFDACAAGRLLMLAPFPYHRRLRTITREQCLTLNDWARAVAQRGAPLH